MSDRQELMFKMNHHTGMLEPTARKTDPKTAHAAAVSVRPKAGTYRAKILEFLEANNWSGATCDEIANFTGLLLQSVTPRMRELKAVGLVRDSGKTRTGSAGVKRIVWEATGWHGDSDE